MEPHSYILDKHKNKILNYDKFLAINNSLRFIKLDFFKKVIDKYI